MKTIDSRLGKIHEYLLAADGHCIRIVEPKNHGDVLEWWSVNGKVIIIQYWGKEDGITCYKAIQEQNNMEAEIKELDIYINS